VLGVISALTILGGFILEVKPMFESARPKPAVLAARWCLWIGTAGLLATVFSGFLLPEHSVIFKNESRRFVEHRFLGMWTATVFVGISVWRYWAGRRPSALLVLVWLAGLWILGAQIRGGTTRGETDVFEKEGTHGQR
jgi:hypothetical protein